MNSPIYYSSTTTPPPSYWRPWMIKFLTIMHTYSPILIYAFSSLSFLLVVVFFQKEVFSGLDDLSMWLRKDALFGYAVLFLLIFITTFPPFPLYSTLIVLSGYTFGAWKGAAVSYLSALTGAVTVFILTRTFFRDRVNRWLSSAVTVKRVIRAIDKKPSLLFLVRICPYPYNVMNCLLAASPTLSFEIYTAATALSLVKVLIHTHVGASIQSFRDYHHSADEAKPATGIAGQARYWTIAGIIVAIGVLVYLTYLARKAVDDELADDAPTEERVGFLSSDDTELDVTSSQRPILPLSQPSHD